MRNGTKPGPTATRQRSKAAARALRRRDLRMGQTGERRVSAESSRRPVSKNAAKGFARSPLPSLADGEKLWWMIAVPSRELLRRVPFVIGVMGLLAVGLATTLWLATRSTEDASTLSAMRMRNRELQQEQERLERGMEQGQSVTQLARRAAELGMVPAQDVAKLVPQPDGSVHVVGELKPAGGTPERPLDGEAASPPAPKAAPPDRRPPAPNAPADPKDEAPAPPAPDGTAEEQVHPPEQAAPDAPAPSAPGEEQGQTPAPNVPMLPPVLSLPPADPAPPMSQAGNQAPAAPPPIYIPPPPVVQEHDPSGENHAPSPVGGAEAVTSQPAAEQPEQEPHE